MKKFITSFLIFLVAASLTLGITAIVHAEGEGLQQLDEILGKSREDKDASGLESFGGRFHKLSSTDPGADIITSVIFSAIDFLKYFMGGVAVLFVIVSGVKLITSGKKVDEISQKEKENLKYIIFGLILIIMADELVTKVFFGDYGECIASASNVKECAKAGGGVVKGIYSLILSVMGTVSVFILALSAFRLVTAYGSEETVGAQKKRIAMAVVGILIAGVGEFVVKKIIFPEGGTKGIQVVEAQKLVYNFTNFVAAFIGAGAFAMLFYGGYLYVVSFGNEEKTGKAKKIMVGAAIGILIALAAFGIVTTISTFSPGGTPQLPGAPK